MTMNLKAVEDVILDVMSGEDSERLIAELERRLKPTPQYVKYAALGGKRKPSHLMQPKVHQVYGVLDERGPLTLPELQRELGEDFPRNTIRYAVQILRQAGMVRSERQEEDV